MSGLYVDQAVPIDGRPKGHVDGEGAEIKTAEISIAWFRDKHGFVRGDWNAKISRAIWERFLHWKTWVEVGNGGGNTFLVVWWEIYSWAIKVYDHAVPGIGRGLSRDRLSMNMNFILLSLVIFALHLLQTGRRWRAPTWPSIETWSWRKRRRKTYPGSGFDCLFPSLPFFCSLTSSRAED